MRFSKKYIITQMDDIINELKDKYGDEYIELLLEIIKNPESKLVSDWSEKIITSETRSAFSEMAFKILCWFVKLYFTLK